MAKYSKKIDSLVNVLTQLPGVGRKSAERMAFYIIGLSAEKLSEMVNTFSDVAGSVSFCDECGNLSDENICEICANSTRLKNIICVVEEAKDISSVEKAKIYRGVYHVLGGRLSPLDGVTPDKLNIASLMDKVDKFSKESEVIIATSSSTEGEATAAYLIRLLKKKNIKTSRIAYGIPAGSSLDYIDGVTMAKSLSGRTIA